MALYFFDASVIVKYFYTEAGSAWVREIIQARDSDDKEYSNTIYIGSISIAEVPAAFSILERRHHIGKRLRDTLYEGFLDAIDLEFRVSPVDVEILYHAAELTQRHPLKGYDSVQLAIALDLRERSLTQDLNLTFVSSDSHLIRAAQAEGMSIENPNSYSNPSPN